MKLRHWALLFIAPLAGRSAEQLSLADHGTFQISIPSGWQFTATRAADYGYTTSLKPKNDAHIKCLVTLFFLQKPEPVDRRKVEEDTLNACEPLVAGSVEKKATLKSFNVSKGYGAYCVFTDASLVGAPIQIDEYKVVATGIVRYSEDVLGLVSIYCDDASGSAMAAMVKAVGSSVVVPRTPAKK